MLVYSKGRICHQPSLVSALASFLIECYRWPISMPQARCLYVEEGVEAKRSEMVVCLCWGVHPFYNERLSPAGHVGELPDHELDHIPVRSSTLLADNASAFEKGSG